MTPWKDLEAKAKELRSDSQSHGINWHWFRFETNEAATEFDQWATDHGFETRGVYDPTVTDDGWGVRVR